MQKWKDIYGELKTYVEEHPDVDIQDNLIDIPRSKQPTFYSIFDKIRDTYIAEEFPELLNEAEHLSTAYLNVAQELTRLLNLEDILMPNDVERFLHKPLDQLRREVFDPLFDLLSGKIGMQRFILETSVNVNSSFKQLYQEGYEKWTVLSLLKLFEPDRIYYVPLRNPGNKQIIKHSVLAKESLPLPVESKIFAFEVGRRQTLLTPDAIIHSARLDKYVAFRTAFTSAMWSANSYSDKREWYSIESLVEEYGLITLRPDLLVYIDDNAEDVSMVADAEKICRPDIVVECIDELNVDKNLMRERLADISSCYGILKPVIGSFVVSRENIPPYVHDQLAEEINLIEAGFAESKLESIISGIKV